VRNNGIGTDGRGIFTLLVNAQTLVFAGAEGRVASYDGDKNAWVSFQDQGLASDGSLMGFQPILCSAKYGEKIIFAGGEGRLVAYDSTLAIWTKYDNDKGGLSGDGSALLNDAASLSVIGQTLYCAGSVGNTVYQYRKGDFIRDSQGNPVVKEQSQHVGYIKGVPAYNRVYSAANHYPEIVANYNSLIANTEKIVGLFIGGGKVTFGVKTTTGRSTTYKYRNLKTGEEDFIDSVALSMYFGVKFVANTMEEDKEYFRGQILAEVIRYIVGLNGADLAVFRMFDTLKTKYPAVDHFEFYSINTYDASVCQGIFRVGTTVGTNGEAESSSVDEALSVKYVVDEQASSEATGVVVLLPDITIKVL
jgi:hypothetical protein